MSLNLHSLLAFTSKDTLHIRIGYRYDIACLAYMACIWDFITYRIDEQMDNIPVTSQQSYMY